MKARFAGSPANVRKPQSTHTGKKRKRNRQKYVSRARRQKPRATSSRSAGSDRQPLDYRRSRAFVAHARSTFAAARETILLIRTPGSGAIESVLIILHFCNFDNKRPVSRRVHRHARSRLIVERHGSLRLIARCYRYLHEKTRNRVRYAPRRVASTRRVGSRGRRHATH